MTAASADGVVDLPAQRGGAKALLLTVLGEFVLPTGGSAWTSTLVAAADALGIAEKNARQAIARIADQELVGSERHGRLVRWSLTPAGRELLDVGAARIYGFGRADHEWSGEWLVAHCPVAEAQRAQRQKLRAALTFQGFGELSPSLAVSPHVEREPDLLQTLDDLGLRSESVVLRSRTGSPEADADLVDRAWNLHDLASSYGAFCDTYERCDVESEVDAFRSTVELVHDWRRFPFVDPELPTELLPAGWIGTEAAALFHDRRTAWSDAARSWFRGHESPATAGAPR